MDPNTFMKESLIESHSNFRGKIQFIGEYGNILQSMPITTMKFLLFDFLIIVFKLLSMSQSKNGKNKGKKTRTRKFYEFMYGL